MPRSRFGRLISNGAYPHSDANPAPMCCSRLRALRLWSGRRLCLLDYQAGPGSRSGGRPQAPASWREHLRAPGFEQLVTRIVSATACRGVCRQRGRTRTCFKRRQEPQQPCRHWHSPVGLKDGQTATIGRRSASPNRGRREPNRKPLQAAPGKGSCRAGQPAA